jgi:hypothetical protein
MKKHATEHATRNKFVGIMVVGAWILVVMAIAFSYDTKLQNALYTLIGLDWLFFGTWAGIILLKDN